jgi:hypothetical protein
MKKIEGKKLSIKKESLRRLQDNSLGSVVGGYKITDVCTQQWWCTSDPCRTDSCHKPCI